MNSVSYKNCVMIVDDNKEFADALAKKFKERGYETAVFYNGDDAVRSYVRIMPDIVLMDKIMPTMDGRKAIEEILKIDPDAVIMGITGYSDKDDDDLVKAGAKNVFQKPLNMANLLAEIEMHIDKVTVNILRERIYNIERGLATLTQEIVNMKSDIEATKIQMAYVAKNSENVVSTFKAEMGKIRNSGLLGGFGGSILVAILSYINTEINNNSKLIEFIVNNSVLVIIFTALLTTTIVFLPQIFGKIMGNGKNEREEFKLPEYLWEIEDALIIHKRKKHIKQKTKNRII